MSNETTAGPYTVGPNDGFGNYRIIGMPVMIGVYKHAHHAQLACEQFNAIYRAGQASREQWIPVTTILPSAADAVDGDVLTLSPVQANILPWNRLHEPLCPVTHWMPLPSPPNKQP